MFDGLGSYYTPENPPNVALHPNMVNGIREHTRGHYKGNILGFVDAAHPIETSKLA